MNFKVSILSPPVSQKFPSRDLLLKELYGMIRSEVFLQPTLKLRAAATPQAARYIKMHEFYHATIAGTFSERSERGLKEMSGYMVFDFDKVEVEAVRKILLTIDELPVCLLFISPSGNGIKAVYKIDLDAHSYLDYFRAISAYLESTCQLQADPSGKDIPRTCFLPCDPNAYFNEDAAFVSLDMEKWLVAAEVKNPTAKSYKQTSLLDAAPTVPDGLETIVRVEQLADYSAQFKIPLAENYNDWVALAMSLASLGESGRAVFLRCCDQYPKKQDQSPDKLFSYCLTHRTGSIGIGTFFKLASDAHIPLRQQEKSTIATKTSTAPSTQKEETDEESGSKHALPTIPASVIQNLPPFFAAIYATGSCPEIADAVLLTAIATLSGAIPNIAGIYDGREYSPHLYISVIGGASVGKGQIALCRRLVNKIHKKLRKESRIARAEYLQKLDEFLNKKGPKKESDRPQKPGRRMLFIPIDNSTTGLLDLLQQNGQMGILFETEIDVMNDSFGKEYGNYSSQLRKIFQNESVAYNRRKDEEYREMEHPALAIILTGTKDQLLTLIPNAKNGLFSRFMFYYMNMQPQWRDVFANGEHTIEQQFDAFGEEFYERYENLVKRQTKIYFKFTRQQELKFNKHFEKVQEQYFELCGEDYISVVRRLGLIAFRIGMVFSVMRADDSTAFDKGRIVCTDQDFECIMEIIKTITSHAAYVFSQLPEGKKPDKPQQNSKLDFYQALPEKFNRQVYLAIALQFGIKPNTADKRIKRFVQKNLLEFDDKEYQKVLHDK